MAGQTPKAGAVAKAIGGRLHGLRKHLNDHASHLSFSVEALGHLVDFESGEIRMHREPGSGKTLQTNLTTLAALLNLVLIEAILILDQEGPQGSASDLLQVHEERCFAARERANVVGIISTQQRERNVNQGEVEQIKARVHVWASRYHVARRIERWLEDSLINERWHEVRDRWGDGHWMWMIPDFDNGRTMVLGVSDEILDSREPFDIVSFLHSNGVVAMLQAGERLLVIDQGGTLELRDWQPTTDDHWIWNETRGEHVHLYPLQYNPVTLGSVPRLPMPPFLAMDSAGRRGKGPWNPRSASTYTYAELAEFLN